MDKQKVKDLLGMAEMASINCPSCTMDQPSYNVPCYCEYYMGFRDKCDPWTIIDLCTQLTRYREALELLSFHAGAVIKECEEEKNPIIDVSAKWVLKHTREALQEKKDE